LTGVRHGKPHYGHGHGGYLVTAPDCISANPQAPTPERKPSFAGQLVACACRRRSCFLPTDRPSPRSWPLVSQLDLALGAPVRRSRPSGGGRRDRRGRTMRGGSLHVPTRRSACLQAPILIDTLARSTDAVLWSGRTGAAGGSHHLPTLNRERSTEYGGGTNSNASIMRRVCYWLPGARPSDDIYLRRDRTRHQAASARHRSARSGDPLQIPMPHSDRRLRPALAQMQLRGLGVTARPPPCALESATSGRPGTGAARGSALQTPACRGAAASRVEAQVVARFPGR
jgi:hypothetical protein